MRDVVVAGAVRTPIGRFGGALSALTPAQLGGATGGRLVVSLLHEMARRRARRGLATLCVSGGMGMAAAFEAA